MPTHFLHNHGVGQDKLYLKEIARNACPTTTLTAEVG